METVAIDSVLVTINWDPSSDRYSRVAKFVEALFAHFADFKKPPRYPKWQEVDLEKELPGWQHFQAAQDWLQAARFNELRAKHEGANAQSESPADKQRMFREFLEWQQSEEKK